jgi:hypothetical protein
MSVLPTVANLAWSVANLPAYMQFAAALEHPRATQEQLLRDYIRRNASTDFGRGHAFDTIDSVGSFQRRVPLCDYDTISPHIDRIANGEANVLTADSVTRLATSSGSTRARKLIPYTRTLQREFNCAIGPWIADLYRTDPSLAAGCAYWSISPVASQPEPQRSPSAPSIGFDEDSAYLGGWRKRMVDAVMAVPGAVRHVSDIDTFRFVTLRHLLRRRDLRLISIWHPTFLELLLDAAAAWWGDLVADVAKDDVERAAELRRLGPDAWERVWPNLALISCWADAHAAGPAEALRKRVPNVRFQSKGLLATEAFVTIPFRRARPLAIRSHFFEFLAEDGSVSLADELRVGQRYGVVVTTGGGLWRYQLGDYIEVEQFVDRTPSLCFVGRADQVVDRFGEKLNEAFVGRTLRAVIAAAGITTSFSMLAPDGPGYSLFIQSPDAMPHTIASRLDEALRANPHYDYCRRLGQLQSPTVFAIRGHAYGQYVAALQRIGVRAGDAKPTPLSQRSDWASIFERE